MENHRKSFESDANLLLLFTFRSAFLTMFMPLLAWLFGVCENETFIMSLITTLCLMTFMYATSILVFHGKNTLR